MLDLIPRDYWQYSMRDLFRALRATLGSRTEGESFSLPDLDGCIPAGSGRAALVLALNALNLRPGAKVGVPLYCCPIVFRAIVRAGYDAQFVDVDPITYCMSAEDLAAKGSTLDAVIAVHMFGNICDMPRLQAAAPQIPFIEDCALALGSKLESKIAGSFGNISIFSFRSGKYVSVGEGGALFSPHSTVRSRLRELTASLRQPTLLEELLHVATTYTKSVLRSKPLYGIIGYRLWVSANEKLNLVANSGIELKQIYKSDSELAKLRLPHLGRAIEAHRANSDSFSTGLTLDPGMVSLELPGFFYNRLHYPIVFPSQETRDVVAAQLLIEGIDSIKYLDEVVEIATASYGYVGGCPVSERLSKSVLLLPNYGKLRRGDVQYVIERLNTIWRRVSPNSRNPSRVRTSGETGNIGPSSKNVAELAPSSARKSDTKVSQEIA